MILAIVLLLLPILYVASYLTLVSPNESGIYMVIHANTGVYYTRGYRNGGEWAWRLYWPLEQIDRRLRPHLWPRTDQ